MSSEDRKVNEYCDDAKVDRASLVANRSIEHIVR